MSTINRGPLGSAFLINRDPASSGGGGSNGGSNGISANPFTPEPRASKAAESSAPTSGPIPMPGPTLSGPSSPSASSSASSSPFLSSPSSSSATATLAPPEVAPPGAVPVPPPKGSLVTTDLARSLAEVKGQAQFLLYLADQIEDSLQQLVDEHDACQNAFLCRVLSMYSAQLETKHHGLGDKIAETCQEVYVTVRDYDTT